MFLYVPGMTLMLTMTYRKVCEVSAKQEVLEAAVSHLRNPSAPLHQISLKFPILESLEEYVNFKADLVAKGGFRKDVVRLLY
jgi:hypothetical protein